MEEKNIFHYIVESMNKSQDKSAEYLEFIGKIIEYMIKIKVKAEVNLKV